jgi:hypothetical protein
MNDERGMMNDELKAARLSSFVHPTFSSFITHHSAFIT